MENSSRNFSEIFNFRVVTQAVLLENSSIWIFYWNHIQYVTFGLDEFSSKTVQAGPSSSRPGFKKTELMIFWWMSFPVKRSQKFPRNLPIRVKLKLDDSGVLFADFDTTNVQERNFYQKCTRVTNQLHTWMMTVSIKVGDTCPSTFFDWSFKDMTRVHLTCYHDSSLLSSPRSIKQS